MTRHPTLRVLDPRSERGATTVAELMIASFMFAILAVSVMGIMASSQSAEARQEARSANNDQARAAMEELDREVRSADVLYNPSNAVDASGAAIPGMGLRIETQTNAGTRGANDVCVQWRLDTTNTLLRRTWPPGNTALVTAWNPVATGIVNRSISPTVRVFKIDSGTSTGSRVVDVTLLVNTQQGTTAHVQAQTQLSNAFAIRNPQWVPTDPCSPVPAG